MKHKKTNFNIYLAFDSLQGENSLVCATAPTINSDSLTFAVNESLPGKKEGNKKITAGKYPEQHRTAEFNEVDKPILAGLHNQRNDR